MTSGVSIRGRTVYIENMHHGNVEMTKCFPCGAFHDLTTTLSGWAVDTTYPMAPATALDTAKNIKKP